MSEGRLERILTGQVYPAMLAQAGPAAPPEAALRLLLRALARLMAEERGLLPPTLTGIVRQGDAAPPEGIAACLAEVAWPGGRDALPGEFAGTRPIPPLRDILDGSDFAQADITLLGQVYTELMPGRKRRGSYYTPQTLAEVVARQTISPLLTSPPQWERRRRAATGARVLDPAMGSGHFLLAAGEIIADWIEEHDPTLSVAQARRAALGCLHGVDADPIAVELAAISLWLWAAPPGTTPATLCGQLACGDALLDDHLWEGALTAPFDAVIGNPPYSSAIARARTPDPERLAALRGRYHTARGSFDLAVPFTELAVSLCRVGGRCGLVLPNKLLSAEYARPLRAWLAETVTVEAILDASQDRPFRAGVYPVACVLRKDQPEMGEGLAVYRHHRPALEMPGYELSCRLEADSSPLFTPMVLVRRGSQADLHGPGGDLWSGVLDPDWEALRRCWEGARPLAEVSRLVGGLVVGEAYNLRPAVFDAPEGDLPEGTFRLVTSGFVRRYGSAWGCAPARYLGQTYRRPAIAGESLPPHRQTQAAATKIIVAGLGRSPRALVDRGQMQASVATTVVIEAGWPLDALCAVLNSQVMGRLCRAIFGGLALGGGHMRFGKPELARIPLPDVAADDPRLARLDALAARRATLADPSQIERAEAEIEALVRDLYHLDREESL